VISNKDGEEEVSKICLSKMVTFLFEKKIELFSQLSTPFPLLHSHFRTSYVKALMTER